MKSRIPVYVTMAIDPALSASERADFTGITVVGTAPDGTWYVMEAEQFKGRPDQVIERCVAHARVCRPQVISLEFVAFSMLYKPLLVPRLTAAGLHPRIHEYRPKSTRSKNQRIEALQPMFKQGRIFIREGLTDLCEQLDHYPELDHDDILDSLAQHLEIARPARAGEIHPEITRDWFEDFAHMSQDNEQAYYDNLPQEDYTDGTSVGRSGTIIRREAGATYGL